MVITMIFKKLNQGQYVPQWNPDYNNEESEQAPPAQPPKPQPTNTNVRYGLKLFPH